MDRSLATEQRLGHVLTVGTRVSSLLLAIGFVVTLFRPSSVVGSKCLTVGIFVLLATPIARVAVSVVEFARLRDWWFVLFTAIVLLLLIGSIIAA